MIKLASTRWDDTIKYLNAKFPLAAPKLGDHIKTIITGKLRSTISDELSLGDTLGVHKNTKANEGARDALRALLLCQRVYFSSLWAKTSFVGNVTYPDPSFLPVNWKATSLGHWGMRDEMSIRSAIAMFAPVAGATANSVADAAQEGPPWPKTPTIAGNFAATRAHFPLTGPQETCYRGVLAWLLKAGVVSYRWFMKNSAPAGEDALHELFGDGEEVWPANRPFTAQSVLPTVEKGFVIHMWMEDSNEGGWNGHWVISNGDGTICGVNNAGVENHKTGEIVHKIYTTTGLLRTQFEGYTQLVSEKMNEKGFLDIVPTGKYARARMVKFDPLKLPGRM